MKGFTKTTGAAPVQILAVVDPQVSFGCIVSDKDVSAGSDGRKVVKAGTPLVGDLTKRSTAFTVVSSTDAAKVIGVLLHDVDVTDGADNGTCLVFGWVNQDMIDTTTQALWTSDVKTALNGKVTLIKV